MDLLPYIVGPLVTLGLTAFIGHRISVHWALRQKRKELAISATTEFRRLYGEFFANWKLWEYALNANRDHFFEFCWDLMKRSTAAEGGVEALLVRLATERRLSEEEVATLGKFRQAYQQLRQAVRCGQALYWTESSHPSYIAFKQLATKTAHLLSTSDSGARPSPDEAAAVLVRITDNRWEATWTESSAIDHSPPARRSLFRSARRHSHQQEPSTPRA